MFKQTLVTEVIPPLPPKILVKTLRVLQLASQSIVFEICISIIVDRHILFQPNIVTVADGGGDVGVSDTAVGGSLTMVAVAGIADTVAGEDIITIDGNYYQ